MNTFIRFFYEFISIFFDGFFKIFKGIFDGFICMFNFNDYREIVNSYKDSFSGAEWIYVIISVIILVIMIGLVGLLLFFIIKRLFFRKKDVNQEELLNEIADLNGEVEKLMKEKDEIMAMKVSQLGLKPGEDPNGATEENKEEKDKGDPNIRFPRVTKVDEELKNFKSKNYGNAFTLEEFIDNFRSFSASKLRLYYDPVLLRPFIAGLAACRIIILQGISGTGKTSLAYAWGKFVKKDSCVASVEPSWRDKTNLVGYFNEFTKKYNETEALVELYRASFDDDIHTIILDEMNIARVEYYFAEFLSILEMPSRDEWIISLVSSGWPSDPKKIKDGQIKLPGNLWYVGTINNDDSTFMVTDKVYDRAMPIDINTKIAPFKCREQDAMDINASYLESLFKQAVIDHPVSEKGQKAVQVLDEYVIKHFRVAFGNRILKQLNTFVPVYVACGGKEIAGIDYFISKKIFRKFDQLNISFIKDELDPFIAFMNKEIGDGLMTECIEFIERLKKSV